MDLINRQDAIKAYQEFSCKGIDCNDCGSTDKDGNCVIETWFNSLPSAEQKKGEWIPVTNGRGGHECNLCHNYAPSYQTGDEWLTYFCPNCGANMRGEKNE